MSNLNPALLNLLCDPYDKSLVSINSTLVTSTNKTYPIYAGIPILINDENIQQTASDNLLNNKTRKGFSWAYKHWKDLGIGQMLAFVRQNSKLSNKFLLNIGSGSSVEKDHYIELGFTPIAIDINSEYQGIDVVADAHHLPFRDGAFGVLTSFEVLEHLHSPWIAAREMNRVLETGGYFVGSVAFMKEFHASYFHMTHWGVKSLLENHGFKLLSVYGGQNIYGRLFSHVLPLGTRAVSEKIYNFMGGILFGLRSWIWSLIKRKPATKKIYNYGDNIQFSFKEYDQLKFAPAVLFLAVKVNDL